MKRDKKIAVFLLILISISCLVPSFAEASERENGSFETFLSAKVVISSSTSSQITKSPGKVAAAMGGAAVWEG